MYCKIEDLFRNDHVSLIRPIVFDLYEDQQSQGNKINENNSKSQI